MQEIFPGMGTMTVLCYYDVCPDLYETTKRIRSRFLEALRHHHAFVYLRDPKRFNTLGRHEYENRGIGGLRRSSKMKRRLNQRTSQIPSLTSFLFHAMLRSVRCFTLAELLPAPKNDMPTRYVRSESIATGWKEGGAQRFRRCLLL